MHKTLYTQLTLELPIGPYNPYRLSNEIASAYRDGNTHVTQTFERVLLEWLISQNTESVTLNECGVRIQNDHDYVFVYRTKSGSVKGGPHIYIPVLTHVFEVRCIDANDGIMHRYEIENTSPGYAEWWDMVRRTAPTMDMPQ